MEPTWSIVGSRGASWGIVGHRGASWGIVGLTGVLSGCINEVRPLKGATVSGRKASISTKTTICPMW